MSEPINMSIEIGGDLPENLIGELLQLVADEITEGDGPTTEKGFKKECTGTSTITFRGQSNYGECDDIKSFCGKHKLSYIHHCEAMYDYDAQINYWVPGMKLEWSSYSTQNQVSLVDVDEIRPLLYLLLDVAKDGTAALPKYLNEERLKDVVEKGLKNPKKLHDLLKKKINKIVPAIPKLPPLRIINAKKT